MATTIQHQQARVGRAGNGVPGAVSARRMWALSTTGAVLSVLGYLVVRPRMLQWGATDQEAREPLPGDDICPNPRVQGTRAITIDAPPERVWPWIVQMGMGRAGFYTHEWVERPLGGYYAEGRSATRIHPEFQDLKVGDLVDYGGGNLVPVHAIEPFRYLVHAEAFVLRPLQGDRTRLLVRYRGMGFISPAVRNLAPDAPLLSRAAAFVVERVPGIDLFVRALDFFISDPLHHYMEVGMLRGIKKRAEGQFEGVGGESVDTPARSVVGSRHRVRHVEASGPRHR